MEIVYTNLVFGAIIVFLVILYLRTATRASAFAYSFGILFMLFLIGLSWLPLIFVALVFLILTHSTFKESKAAYAVVIMFFLLSSTTIVSAAPPDTLPPQVPAFVREVGRVTQQPSIDLKGTDYYVGDNGKLQAYLKVGDYPLESAACYVDVLYPNMTFFITDQLMISAGHLHHFEGLYYYDFIVPNVTGVYPVNAYCFYNATKFYDYVSGAWSGSFIEAEDGIKYYLMNMTDGNYYRVKDSGSCNDINCSFFFNFTLPTGWHTDLLSDARIYFVGYLDDNKDNLTFYVYNNNTRIKWFSIIEKDITYNYQFIINSSFKNNTNIKLEVQAFDWDDSKLHVDYLAISRIYNGSYVGDLRGNDELVVSRGGQTVITEITSDLEFVSGAITLQLLLLFLVLGLIIYERTTFLGGIGLFLWTILYVQNFYLIILFCLLGIVFMFSGYQRNKK